MILYHSIFRANLPSIKKEGLGARQRKNWDISKNGVTYFSDNPDVAFSYCEAADEVSEAKYDSGIIVLAVDTKTLDPSKLGIDTNIRDQEENKCYVYSGVINPNYIAVVKSDGKLVGILTKLKRVPSYE